VPFFLKFLRCGITLVTPPTPPTTLRSAFLLRSAFRFPRCRSVDRNDELTH